MVGLLVRTSVECIGIDKSYVEVSTFKKRGPNYISSFHQFSRYTGASMDEQKVCQVGVVGDMRNLNAGYRGI